MFNNTVIQAVRILGELAFATGLSDNEALMQELSETTDLPKEDIMNILDRAGAMWEYLKGRDENEVVEILSEDLRDPETYDNLMQVFE